MQRIRKIITPVLFATACLVPFAAGADVVRQMTISGKGVVSVVPDMATLTLGVQHRDKDPKDAMEDTAKAAQDVISALKKMGLNDKDLQTSNLSLHTIESYGANNKRRIDGYEASTTLRVQLRDLDQIGAVVSVALKEGANHFSGLRFGLTDPQQAQNDAYQAAVKNALSKAALYAEAANVTLGDVISVSDIAPTMGPMPAPMLRMEMSAKADMPIEAGELALSHQVTVVVGLQ